MTSLGEIHSKRLQCLKASNASSWVHIAAKSLIPRNVYCLPNPPPPSDASVQLVRKWYEESEDHILAAKEILRKHDPIPSDIAFWKVALYHLIIAYIVNFRLDDVADEAIEAVKNGQMIKASSLVEQSQRLITEASRIYDLSYIGLVDLAKVEIPGSAIGGPQSGPFAGVFVQEGREPFIILSFKGTTYKPEIGTNFMIGPSVSEGEDTLYNKKTHKGMNKGLFTIFPNMEETAFDIIWEGLISIALDLKENVGGTEHPIPLYISGHSLGAGYASLTYVEVVRRLSLGPVPFDLKGLWAFASPRVGLNDLALKVNEVKAGRPVYRFSRERDLVPFLPYCSWTNYTTVFKHFDGGHMLRREYPPYNWEEASEIGGESKTDDDGNAYWDFHFPPEYYYSIKTVLGDEVTAPIPDPEPCQPSCCVM